MSSAAVTATAVAVVYILSGIGQPLLMTACKNAGLANSSAQLYMLFYYAGPSSLLLTLLPGWCRSCRHANPDPNPSAQQSTPSAVAMGKASLIACFDIAAQTLNYTGASLAGATVFAVVYSSVTVWTAVFSRLVLGRTLTGLQWAAIVIVFAGLCITALDGVNVGRNVAHGTLLVVLGSCMHGATYVMSEAIMATQGTTIGRVGGGGGGGDDAAFLGATISPTATTTTTIKTRETLSARENSAIQGAVACTGLMVWQIVYTVPRWNALIRLPVQAAGTTTVQAATVLISFGLANLMHSFSFFHTLAHFPGGATSAGVMKGLQAVLVFVAAGMLYCTRSDTDACFSTPKFVSLITVVGGVVLFSASTDQAKAAAGYTSIGNGPEYGTEHQSAANVRPSRK